MNPEAEALIADIQEYGLDRNLMISVEVREVDERSAVTDIWLNTSDEAGPEVLVTHVADDPDCRINVHDFTFEAVHRRNVPEFVYRILQGDLTLTIEKRFLSRWRVLRLTVAGLEYVAAVRLIRDGLDEWEAALL